MVVDQPSWDYNQDYNFTFPDRRDPLHSSQCLWDGAGTSTWPGEASFQAACLGRIWPTLARKRGVQFSSPDDGLIWGRGLQMNEKGWVISKY